MPDTKSFPRSQTLFGTPVLETPFRAPPTGETGVSRKCVPSRVLAARSESSFSFSARVRPVQPFVTSFTSALLLQNGFGRLGFCQERARAAPCANRSVSGPPRYERGRLIACHRRRGRAPALRGRLARRPAANHRRSPAIARSTQLSDHSGGAGSYRAGIHLESLGGIERQRHARSARRPGELSGTFSAPATAGHRPAPVGARVSSPAPVRRSTCFDGVLWPVS